MGTKFRQGTAVFGFLSGFAAVLASCSSNTQDRGPSSGLPNTVAGTTGSAGTRALTGGQGALAGTSGGAAGTLATAGGAGMAGGAATGSGGATSPAPDAGAKTDSGTKPAPDAGANAAQSAMRFTAINLRDPHFYYSGQDITDMSTLGMSINGNLIAGGLTMDYDNDGYVDLSYVLLFKPLDPAAMTASLQLVSANCKPTDLTHCTPKGSPAGMWTIDNKATGTCLDVVAGTTGGFSPAVGAPAGPCFVTEMASDLTVTLGGISLPLTAAKIGGTYQGTPPNMIMNGLIAGFLTKSKAMTSLLPDYLGPPLAGTPLSDYLQANELDTAQSPTPSHEDGYWLYLNFTAQPITYAAK